jgi:hypothetical protein
MAKLPEAENTKQKEVAEKVEVVLIAEHEHGGELKKTGESITVNQRQHEWLREQGKVE